MSVTINGPIEINPFTADLDIGLIDPSGRPGRFGIPIPALFEFRHKALHSAQNGGVGGRQATLGHHLDQIPIGKLVG